MFGKCGSLRSQSYVFSKMIVELRSDGDMSTGFHPFFFYQVVVGVVLRYVQDTRGSLTISFRLILK